MRKALADPRAKQVSRANRRFRSRYTEPRPSCGETILACERVTREERLSVYAEGYFIRLREYIQAVFPRTCRALGEKEKPTIVEFLKQHPPRSEPLGDMVGPFEKFVQRRNSGAIRDLVSLEAAMEKVYAGPPVLATHSGGFTPRTRLRFHPNILFISSRWAITPHTQALKPLKARRTWAVYRHHGPTQVLRVPQCVKVQSGTTWLKLPDFCAQNLTEGALPVETRRFFEEWTAAGLIQLNGK